MNRSLEAVKAAVSGKFLGRAGIHGIGIRHSQNALMVYLHGTPSADRATVLREIEAEALPYQVLTVSEDQPVIH